MPTPRQFVTKRRVSIRGKPVEYTATAGETIVSNLANEPIASIFSFAYVRSNPGNAKRPVLFIFNGGPGSSSIWLHMGIFGPRRLVLDSEVNPSNTPPFGLQDNPYSLLDIADLVFIDPVGTGYSHAVGNARNEDFYGVDEDAESIARFIELWLTKNGRWNSPKYLVGESYGSIRAAVLSRALMGGVTYTGVMRGITLDGVILLGVALNAGVVAPPDAPRPNGPDPSAVTSLPSLAVTAWYHNRIARGGRDAGAIYAEATAFAKRDYADALARLGAGTLPEAEKLAIAQRLSDLTGLPAEAWLKAGLRMSVQAYGKQLLAPSNQEVGMYDSRYTLPLALSGGDPVSDDPAMGRYVPGFVASFHDMLKELKVDMPVPYGSIVWEGLNPKWNWVRAGVPAGQNFAGDLAIAMRRNPRLRVLSASGYYDMVTTPNQAEKDLRGSGAAPDRVFFRNYESGHMLYLGGTARLFADDVRAFVLDQLPPQGR
ncbi:peptidase S10 [Sphingomonas sp. MG17]|uniref:Peptidase S10 n=1 Tax=Sphingomonas tagetis TaxID=2949092 RepID=A0A9X2HQS0_9SPHN|nr:peptidase S10 [Sphingomonas tagetis]MCP3732711.1 peptidase S10 [Sphingomonas tagetis]